MRSAAIIASLITVALLVFLVARGDGGEDTPAALSFESGPPVEQATVWAVGDGDAGEAAEQVADLIGSADPDRLLYLGDVYERGTAEQYERNYEPTYGELAEITSPTPGNHEWPTHRDGYDPYWTEVAGRVLHSYTFDVAGWEVLSLNSEGDHGPGSEQLRWLRSELGEEGTCRIAYWHQPRFSAGIHGDEPDLAPLLAALAGRARIVLTGHDHNYQRFELEPELTQFVVGTGGHGLYPIDEDDPRPEASEDSEFGALRLELEDGLARFAFVTAAGEVLDRGRVDCEPLEGD